MFLFDFFGVKCHGNYGKSPMLKTVSDDQLYMENYEELQWWSFLMERMGRVELEDASSKVDMMFQCSK